jgi:thiamine biosynthesis protein ThiC
VKTVLGKVDINVTLGVGAFYKDYNTTVKVIVADSMGATTTMDIDTVRVSRVQFLFFFFYLQETF